MKIRHLITVLALATTVFLPLEMRAADTNLVVQPRIAGQRIQLNTANKNLQAFRRDLILQRRTSIEANRRAAAEMRRAQLQRQGIPRVVPPIVLQQYDINGNGVLDPDEWAKYLADQSQKQGKTYSFGSPSGLDARIVTVPAKHAAH